MAGILDRAQPVDMNYFLARKYALLQQQADAGTSQAQTQSRQADTGALVGAAAANLDRTRAGLLPGESAAQIAQQGAQTRLLGEQASIVQPLARAQIGQIGAETGLTTTQNKVLTRTALTPYRSLIGSALGSTLGAGGYQGFQLPAAGPAVVETDDTFTRRYR